MKLFLSGDGKKRTLMGCVQLRRWLSFLPAGFVVYILLHYLVYQPHFGQQLAGVARIGMTVAANVSMLPDRSLTGESRVLPFLSEDSLASHLEGPSAKKDLLPSNSSASILDSRQGVSSSVSSSVVSASVSSSSKSASAPKTAKASPPARPVAPPRRKTATISKTVVAADVALNSLAIDALHGNAKVGDLYDPGFSVPHEEICANNGRDLKALILITTAPDHQTHRTAIRRTWGHFSLRRDLAMAFVIGRTSKPEVQAMVDGENELFGDLIQANFVDHYGNLTLKTVSILEWIKTYCSEVHFVLKTDDDMYINVPLLLAFIDSKKDETRVMYGRLAKGWKPVRNKKSKYYVSVNTYRKVRYPDFLTGPAYLFTSDVVEELYGKVLATTFFFLEDVLIMGIVSESLHLKRIGDSRFRNDKIKMTDTCKLMETISVHMVKYEEQFDIYKRTLDGKTKCKKG